MRNRCRTQLNRIRDTHGTQLLGRRFSPILTALLVATTTSLALGVSSVAATTAARYLVFKTQPDGSVRAVSSTRVQLRGKLQSRGGAAAQATRDSDQVHVRLEDARRSVVFEDTVTIPRWVRGEFHDKGPGALGEFTIDGHVVPQAEVAFVVRVPDVADATLVLESTRIPQGAQFDLDAVENDPAVARAAPAVQPPPISGWSNGDPANRLDILIMGDGYTAAQQTQFETDAQNLVNSFFGIAPYDDYRNYVNALALFTPSAQSGADQPPYVSGCSQFARQQSCCGDPDASGTSPTTVSTALDGTFCSFNIQRLVTVDNGLVFSAAAAEPNWDEILVLVHSPTYGGSGGAIGVISTHGAAVQVAQHEFGHSFMQLADEYDNAYPGYPACSDLGGSPCEANVTNQTSRPLIKWTRWIDGAQPVPSFGPPPGTYDAGLWEGARYLTAGMYRQGYACIMRYLGAPFCNVDGETYPLRLYGGGWGVPGAGIDNIEPGSESPAPGSVSAPYPGGSYSATVLGPQAGPDVTADWYVDSILTDTESLATGGTASHTLVTTPGLHTLELRITDNSPIIHPTMRDGLASSRTWNVTVGPNPCGNSMLDPGETCDDADATGGDGCSATCQVETCYQCTGMPSVCGPDNGAPCSNGDPCVVGETCSGVVCGGGSTIVTCTDGDGCCPVGCTIGNDIDCVPPTPTPTPTPTRTPTLTPTPTVTVTPELCNDITIIPAGGGTFNGATSGGSLMAGSCGGGTGFSPEVVYEWTPAFTGLAQITTCGGTTNFDTVLYVQSTCGGSEIACNDDSACGLASSMPLSVTAGQTYTIVVDGYGGASGNYTLTVSEPSDATPISGKKLLIKDKPDQTRRKIAFLSKDFAIDTTTGTGIDPVADGATFQVYNATGSGESACFPLPAASWAMKGALPNPVYKYKDSQFTNGPCKVSTVKDGKLLKVVCQAKVQPIAYSLDELTQGAVAVRFKSGTTTYCARFGGVVSSDSGTDPPVAGGKGQFKAKDAPPPPVCPPAPSTCP